jgi:hypothetical protein
MTGFQLSGADIEGFLTLFAFGRDEVVSLIHI